MAVLSISAALGGAVVVAAVVVSVLVVDRPREPSRAAESTSNSSLLVVTWGGPALCKVDPPNPGCRSGHVGSLGPAFILHGLWPQPPTQQFCGVPKGGRNPSLAELKLPQGVQTDLQSMMSDAGVMAPPTNGLRMAPARGSHRPTTSPLPRGSPNR